MPLDPPCRLFDKPSAKITQRTAGRFAGGGPGYDRVEQEYVWGSAVHRVAAEGISPEQAVDEAIARVKQILKE